MMNSHKYNALGSNIHTILSKVEISHVYGYVSTVVGTQIKAIIPYASIGDVCLIRCVEGQSKVAEIVGFEDEISILGCLGNTDNIRHGQLIQPLFTKHRIKVNSKCYGNIYDGIGRSIGDNSDGVFVECSGSIGSCVMREAPPATQKERISEIFNTGVKVIDGMLTIGVGQRIGLFAGAGCGKTTLLTTIARGSSADVTVVCLVGERGRELKEMIDHDFDEKLKRTTIFVCATSDKSAMERARAAFTATAIAEEFRDQGKNVLLLVDSLTRFARAQREIGLASGEPPAKGGFPPSVYSLLPKLIERSGLVPRGSITAIYTLLLEGDSMMDPIGDEAKSLLDGHIVLSRKLAEKGVYPAIDVLKSISRTMDNVVSNDVIRISRIARAYMSQREDMELLIRLGEYKEGNDATLDIAISKANAIQEYFRQETTEHYKYKDTIESMENIIL